MTLLLLDIFHRDASTVQYKGMDAKTSAENLNLGFVILEKYENVHLDFISFCTKIQV